MGVQINGDTGNVIATKGTFSGDVGIGGTLTYEDVTNIDSVGLVTARSGIEVGARPGVAASISVDGNMIVSGISTFNSRVLLGTTTEGISNADDLTVATSGHTGITIRSGTSAAGAIYFSDATSGAAEYDGAVIYNQSSQYMDFYTAQSARLRITSDKVQFSVDAKVDSDNARDLGASGARWKDLYLSGGIQFDSRNNKLDDYEEGTFTMTMTPLGGGSITLSTALDSLRYTKIGNLVTIHGRIRIESVNNPQGGIQIGGLPYASIGNNTNSQDGYQHFMVNTHGVNFDNNTVQTFGEMSPNSTNAGLFSMFDNANWALMNASLIQGNQNEYFGFSFFYHTAS